MSKIKALIVEDDDIARIVADKILKDYACEADVAFDGMSCLNKLKKNKYNLILLDIGLPDINGLEVARRIRNNNLFNGIIIVALTAHGDSETRKSSFDAGINHFLEKPFTYAKCQALIERFF